MNDIKTRPKTREVKVRDVAVLAPRELSKRMRDSAKAKQLRQRELEEQGTEATAAVRDAQSEYEGDVKAVSAYGIRKAYSTGKQLSQKRYDKQFRTNRFQIAKQADHSEADGQPVSFSGEEMPQTLRAKQKFRKSRASQWQERGREIKLRAEQTEHRKTVADMCQQDIALGEVPMVPERSFAFGRGDRTKVATLPNKKAPIGSASKPKTGPSNAAARAKAYTTQKMQRKMAQVSTQKKIHVAKSTAKRIFRLKDAVVRAGKAVARAAVGLLGGAGGLIALVLLIGGAAAIMGTPFGVFWSGQDANAVSMSQAVEQIGAAFTAKINQIQTEHPTDSVVIHRIPDGGSDLFITNWTDIVAVFAVKTAGADADADDVVTMDEKRVRLLSDVFWDMNAVTYSVETLDDETILHITITSKTAEEMPSLYQFNKSQNQALTEMLKPEYAQMLAELMGTYGGELALSDEQVKAMLSKMPENLSADRQAVVQTAYSLLGKVNYFWGGKSSAIGWDKRWGTPKKVTAPGSRTTGSVRPYGLDCSGFVDWVFHNAQGYVIGHGGGAHMQHIYCTPISWSEALPGDLVFYPGDSHVGVFVGTDEGGKPLIIHCASSQNNVVLTGLQGFTSIGRPTCYSN